MKQSNRGTSSRGISVDRKNIKDALLPELELIKDSQLREKVVDAWQLACSLGGYQNIEDIPTEAFEMLPDTPNIRHQREAARIAASIVNGLKELNVKLNEDYVIAATLCHDLGKAVEWRKNQTGFYFRGNDAGTFYGSNQDMPPLNDDVSYQVARHPVWGFYIAMTVGMPEHVAHMIGAHSYEGEHLFRSPEARIVRQADVIWWEQVARQRTGQPKDVVRAITGTEVHSRRMDWNTGLR